MQMANDLAQPLDHITDPAPGLHLANQRERFQSRSFPTLEGDEFLGDPARGPVPTLDTLQYHSSAALRDDFSSEVEVSTCHNISPLPSDSANDQGSLENIPGAFTFYIGPTGTSDVYLLRRQAFLGDHETRNVATGLKFRLAERPERPVYDFTSNDQQNGHMILPAIFGITEHTIINNAEPRADLTRLECAWSELWQIMDRDTAWRLTRLYVRFIEPYFPVLATNQAPRNLTELESMSLSLLAGICATALPFAIYDEALYTLLPRPPSTQKLYRICWLALWQEFHAPTTYTLQACLILQHQLPTNPVLSDTAFKWSLMSTAVSVAQTIGLHREPSSWHLVPVHERKLRRRLWWALHTMEKWFALARGMPSHITEDEFDVEALDTQDLEGSFSTTDDTRAHFESLVSLTAILSEVQQTFYTVRASKLTANDLQASLAAARPLRAKLCLWNERLPARLKARNRTGDRKHLESSANALDANASLHLSYIATHMTLFRALLRPLDQCFDIGRQSPNNMELIHDRALAIVKGAIICVKELVEFVEGLTDAQWNAFWHSCKTSHPFTSKFSLG